MGLRDCRTKFFSSRILESLRVHSSKLASFITGHSQSVILAIGCGSHKVGICGDLNMNHFAKVQGHISMIFSI